MSSPIYFMHDDMDLIFEERGNTFSSVRKIQWAKEGEEPDKSKAKIEIRKWYASPDGERAGKGFTFQSEEGVSALTETLVDNNYGNTKNLLLSLRNRSDFKEAVEHLNDKTKEDETSDEYFDAREILL
jgi:hypothetical protein